MKIYIYHIKNRLFLHGTRLKLLLKKLVLDLFTQQLDLNAELISK